MARNESVNRRLEQGLCVRCEKPMDRKGWYCSECASKAADYRKAQVKRWKEQGLCFRCGAAVDQGYKTCFDCRIKLSEDQAIRLAMKKGK